MFDSFPFSSCSLLPLGAFPLMLTESKSAQISSSLYAKLQTTVETILFEGFFLLFLSKLYAITFIHLVEALIQNSLQQRWNPVQAWCWG